VIHHVTNRHKFTGNRYYHRCDHPRYSKEEMKSRNWLKPGSPGHETLKKVVLNKTLVKDMEKLNLNIYTTYLEVFHSLKIRYLPKSIFFEKEKMISGVKLAAMDHNYNVGREQATKKKEGNNVKRFAIAYSKASKKFTAKKIKVDKSYKFLKDIAVNSYYRAVDGEKLSKEARQSRKRTLFVAPEERPDRDTIIKKSIEYSRF